MKCEYGNCTHKLKYTIELFSLNWALLAITQRIEKCKRGGGKQTRQNSKWGGVKTERVFPGISVLRKNNKMEVLSPEK